MSTICQIYRSAREEGMYLYCRKAEGLESVPEELLQRFGRAEPAMVLLLTPEKKLARADAGRVLEALAEKGYYLQLPPVPYMDDSARDLAARNDKLT